MLAGLWRASTIHSAATTPSTRWYEIDHPLLSDGLRDEDQLLQPVPEVDQLVESDPPSSSESLKDRLPHMIDATTEPCDNFYRHACGGWIDKFKVPSDHSSWDYSFSGLGKITRNQVVKILDGTADSELPAELQSKMHDLYAGCTNDETLEKLGTAPLAQLVNKYADPVDSAETFITQLKAINRETGGSQLMGLGISADARDPDKYIAELYQGGLALPDRSYYLDKSDSAHKLLQAYTLLVQKGLTLSTDAALTSGAASVLDDATMAQLVVQFETELAKIQLDKVALRDPETTYNPMSKQQVQQRFPQMFEYVSDTGADSIWGSNNDLKLNVATLDFFDKLETLITDTQPTTLQAFVRWSLANDYVGALGDKDSQPFFDFYGTTMSGIKERTPRWKRCVILVEKSFPEIIGRDWVKSHLTDNGKKQAQDLIDNIEQSFKESLQSADWVSDTTRAKALHKLSKVTNQVGFPAKWREYKDVSVDQATHFENQVNINAAANMHNLNKINKPVDKLEWGMGVYEVNAYYDPSTNQMVFPAGILQKPFFEVDNEEANYGAIGAVMGHELSHGFDDQGSQYDSSGKLNNWWTADDLTAFKSKAKCFADEYSGFTFKKDDGGTVHVNGELTEGENIADNGGIRTSYNAMQRYIKTKEAKQVLLQHIHPSAAQLAEEVKQAEQHTPEQLFFYAYAQTWCMKTTAKAEEMQVKTDPHSPGEFRVNGVVRNFDKFAEAFNCRAKSNMNPSDSGRCVLW